MHFPNCWGMCLDCWSRGVLAGVTEKRPKHIQLPQKGRVGFVISALGGNDAPFAQGGTQRRGSLGSVPPQGCSPIMHHGTAASCAPSSISARAASPAVPEMSFGCKGTREQGWVGSAWGPCEKPSVSGEHQHLSRDTKKGHDWKQDYFCFSAHPCVLSGRPHRAGVTSLWSAPVQASDAVTETSSRQGSQPCSSTAQLETKSNHRLQDTY